MSKDTRIKKISRITAALLISTASITLFAVPVKAAPWRGGGPRWHGDIRYFHERDIGVWRGGYWSHGWHAGRFGWWWVIPGRLVLLSGADLSLSRSLCSSRHSGSAGTAGCAGAATNSIVVLLR